MGRKLKYPEAIVRIDRETGEILSEIPVRRNETYRLVDKSRDLSAQQIRYLNESDEMKKFNNDMGGFIIMYYNNLLYDKKLNLDLATISRCIYLATYIDYDTNILVVGGGYASGKEKKPMKRKDLVEVMQLSDGGFKTFLKTAKENGILIQNKDKTYSMNREYFVKGKGDLKQEFTRVYIDVVRELYLNCKSSQHKTLAYAFKLISKMDYKTNIICHNPNDRYNDPEKMTLKDIGEFFEIDTEKKNLNKFKNNLYKIVIYRNGRKYYIFNRVILENGGGQRDYFIVNPMLFYQGNDYSQISPLIQQLLIK